jgi:hypothetical protein
MNADFMPMPEAVKCCAAMVALRGGAQRRGEFGMAIECQAAQNPAIGNAMP